MKKERRIGYQLSVPAKRWSYSWQKVPNRLLEEAWLFRIISNDYLCIEYRKNPSPLRIKVLQKLIPKLTIVLQKEDT